MSRLPLPAIVYFLTFTLTLQSQETKKATAAVLDFKITQGLSPGEGVTLTNKFRSSLAKTQVYDVLERSDMEAIMKEQDMSLSELCDNTDCAVEVGKLLVAKKMVIGEIGKIGSTYSVTTRVIDVSSGKVDFAESEQYKGDAEGLFDVFDRLALKLTGKYSSSKTWWYVGSAIAAGGASAILFLGKKKSGGSGGTGAVFDLPPNPPNP